MAKISELSHAELLKNIKKYEEIVKQLYAERDKRLRSDPALKEELLTAHEKTQRQEDPPPHVEEEEEDKKDDDYSLAFDEEELAGIEEQTQASEHENELIGVTKLLSLPKEELEKLQATSGKKDKKGKKE